MSARIAKHQGDGDVIGVDLVPKRLEMARRHGITVLDVNQVDDVPDAIRDLTGGRGADSVIDAVGLEAHGAPAASAAQAMAGWLPDKLAEKLNKTAGVDRLSVLYSSIDALRRGGTLSVIGLYGGAADPIPMIELFDKQIQIRMGQANVKRWVDDLMPLLLDDSDPLGVEDLATHKLLLEDAAHGYEIFQNKKDEAIKVILQP